MLTQANLLDFELQLNGTMCVFRAELKKPKPHLETLEQIVEDFRDILDILDSEAQSLRTELHRMEGARDAVELAAT